MNQQKEQNIKGLADVQKMQESYDSQQKKENEKEWEKANKDSGMSEVQKEIEKFTQEEKKRNETQWEQQHGETAQVQKEIDQFAQEKKKKDEKDWEEFHGGVTKKEKIDIDVSQEDEFVDTIMKIFQEENHKKREEEFNQLCLPFIFSLGDAQRVIEEQDPAKRESEFKKLWEKMNKIDNFNFDIHEDLLEELSEIIKEDDLEKRKLEFTNSFLEDLTYVSEIQALLKIKNKDERLEALEKWVKEKQEEEEDESRMEVDLEPEEDESRMDVDLEPEEEATVEQEDDERSLRNRKIWNIIYQVAGGITGGVGSKAFAGGVIATGGPVAIAGVFVAGTILFLKRKDVGQFMGDLMNKRISNLESQQESPEARKKLERARRHKEILTNVFTGMAGGSGAGLFLGGASAVGDLVSSAYGAEAAVEPTAGFSGAEQPEIPTETITEPSIETPVETTPTEISNFGEIGNSVNVTEQMNLNPDVVNQAMQEGRLLGPNLLLEGSQISNLQGSFVEILNSADLSNIDLSTTENTQIFFEGIYEINRQAISGTPIDQGTIQEIAQRTINSFK